MTCRSEVTVTRAAAEAATGAKADEEPRSAPQTRPASSGSPAGGPESLCCSGPPAGPLVTPTARLLLPADASEAEWHAARAGGIGGSDVAAILGMDRYRGPLHVFEDKHGRATFTDNEPAKWGRRLEALIAEGFGEETGLEIADPPGTLVHAEHPWARANVDRYALEDHAGELPDIAPLECKNRSEHQWRDWDDEVPDGPALQLHWYLAVGGWSHGWVAALIGGNRLRWHRLERDEELVAHLLEYCGQWWHRHIVDGVPPDPDGSAATTELLAHLWDVRPGAEREVDPAETLPLIERRAALKARAAELETELGAVENRLKAALGEAEIATVAGRKAYSWVANGTFRAGAFREEQPELAAEYIHLVPAVDTDRLSEDHPDTYRTYRARVLRVPKKGPTS